MTIFRAGQQPQVIHYMHVPGQFHSKNINDSKANSNSWHACPNIKSRAPTSKKLAVKCESEKVVPWGIYGGRRQKEQHLNTSKNTHTSQWHVQLLGSTLGWHRKVGRSNIHIDCHIRPTVLPQYFLCTLRVLTTICYFTIPRTPAHCFQWRHETPSFSCHCIPRQSEILHPTTRIGQNPFLISHRNCWNNMQLPLHTLIKFFFQSRVPVTINCNSSWKQN